MKTLQEQYNLIKEGKGHKDVFMKEAKRLFPNIVPNAATFNQTAKLLKQRSVISENIFPLMPSAGLNPFTSFDKFVNEEVKADEKKTTKEVNQAEIAGYDYKDPKNLNNQIFDQYLNGLRVEMEKDPKLTLDEAKEVVAKNLEKDPIFYTKNAAFKVDGLGYQELKNSKEPTGKHKSSGYGDLKENKMSKSNDLKELLEEAVAGIPSIGNPFADRKKENYETKFAAFLSEEKEETNELFGIGKKKQPKTIDDVKNRYNELAKEKAELDNQLKGGGTPTEKWTKQNTAVKNEMLALAKKLGFDADDKNYKALQEGEAAYEYEKGKEAGEKMKKEEKEPKKEGKMKFEEVVKKAEKLGEMAKNKVMMEIYGKKKKELEETLNTINEDSNLAEFIDENKKAAVQKEIALYEKYYMNAEANYNNGK